jgi:N-acetylglutamate synthase-like GNAT family acetyltransferase
MTAHKTAPATPADLPPVLALLTASGLPHDGLAEQFDAAVVARDGDAVVGSAALELYDEAALLRSVVVARRWWRCVGEDTRHPVKGLVGR